MIVALRRGRREPRVTGVPTAGLAKTSPGAPTRGAEPHDRRQSVVRTDKRGTTPPGPHAPLFALMQDTTRPARCAPAARDRRLPNTPVSLAEADGRGAAACPRARATDRRAGASRGLCGGGADGGRPRYPCMRVWQVAGPSRGAQRAGRVVAVRDFWACGQGGCGAEPVRDGALPGVMGRNDRVTASARWRLCLLGGGR